MSRPPDRSARVVATARPARRLAAAVAVVACEAAYRGGGPWVDALVSYLNANYLFMRAFFEDAPVIHHDNRERGYFAASGR